MPKKEKKSTGTSIWSLVEWTHASSGTVATLQAELPLDDDGVQEVTYSVSFGELPDRERIRISHKDAALLIAARAAEK